MMNNNFIFDSNPYVFDTDKNGFPIFTEKNIKFITAMINNDSNYRVSLDVKHPDSSAFLLKKGFPKEKGDLKICIERIDKENSTHLAVSGNKEGDNKGIEITVEKIFDNIDKISSSIENGKMDIVDEIADFVDGRYNISFASKFCAFCNRYCFDKDDYSIYDSVIRDILPYYAYVYLGEKHWRYVNGKPKRNESNIQKEFANKDGRKNYAGYNDLIGRIIDKANSVFNSNLLRKDFDLLLWYYFKGDDTRIKKANKCLGDKTKIFTFSS